LDAFESVVAMLLRRDGYWITPSFKVELTKAEKRSIGRHSAPRWEIDMVAYKGSANEILAVECKSFLDSAGVIFRNGAFEPAKRYKLFTEPGLRKVVLRGIVRQLKNHGACAADPRIRLALAAGKIAKKSDREGLIAHFQKKGWLLFDDHWARAELIAAANDGYVDDVAHVVAKLLSRGGTKSKREEEPVL
jgi:hypothetical protein